MEKLESIIELLNKQQEIINLQSIAIEKLCTFADLSDCDLWILCRLWIEKMKEDDKKDLWNNNY